MQSPLDTSAFTQHISYAEAWRERKGLVLGLVIPAPAILVFVLLFMILTILPLWAAGISVWPFLLFTGIILAVGLFGYLKLIQRALRIKRFAVANNLTQLHGPLVSTHTGVIFSEGHARSIRLGFLAQGRAFEEIANYQYITGSGRSRQTHNYAYMSIPLPRRLPNIMLDAKNNNYFGTFTNLPTLFPASQKIQLEGDFNKYFTVYVPKQYEQDALYILTPDIMQALIANAKDFDVEVVDNRLYLYKSGAFALDKPAALAQLAAIAEVLHKEFTAQTDYYADHRLNNRSVDMVFQPGQRLRRYSLGTIISALVILIYAIVYALKMIG